MLRNLASSLFLSERDDMYYDGLTQPDGRPVNAPQAKGRVVTTLQKAKEVRPLVEKCITIARRSLEHEENAQQFDTDADRNSDEWKQWRGSDQWQQWNEAISPAVSARRRAIKLLGDKEAVQILFDEIAPRFADREGGYTRVVRLATPRLGDAGIRAILELVGVHDRVSEKSEKPTFTDDDDVQDDSAAEEAQADDEESSGDESNVEASADEEAESEGEEKGVEDPKP